MPGKEKHKFRPGIISRDIEWIDGWLIDWKNSYVITTCSKVHNKGNILSFQCEHLLRKYSNFFISFVYFAVVKEELILLQKNLMFFTLSKLKSKIETNIFTEN